MGYRAGSQHTSQYFTTPPAAGSHRRAGAPRGRWQPQRRAVGRRSAGCEGREPSGAPRYFFFVVVFFFAVPAFLAFFLAVSALLLRLMSAPWARL